MSKNNNKKYIAFVILIGGKSTRFGSDKGIFELNGKAMIDYQLEVLSKYNKDIFLVAHSSKQVQNYIEKVNYTNITAFIVDDRTLIPDDNIRTPIIGMYTAFNELDKLDYKKAFTISCDMPLIKPQIIELLIKCSEKYDCCIPRWENNYLEPLFAIYPIKLALEKIKLNLKNKSYQLTKILDENWKIRYISIEKEIYTLDKDFLTFFNINMPTDIEKFSKIFQKN
jgi:molybdopterin-guanine dinucleotide biosynthesis protein A